MAIYAQSGGLIPVFYGQTIRVCNKYAVSRDLKLTGFLV